MDERAWMAGRFEEHRSHLRSVAYRMLGSLTDADDAVQEAWLRLSRTDSRDVENLRAWLTTVVARVCLNVLRSRESRGEEPVTPQLADSIPSGDGEIGPEDEMLLADSVGLALLVVLERLPPAERLAFVLHDMFSVPFEEIAPIVGRSPAAARQLASRARARIQGAPPPPVSDQAQRRRAVEAFLAASRNGDFAALLAVLDPEVVLRADRGAPRAPARAQWYEQRGSVRPVSERALLRGPMGRGLGAESAHLLSAGAGSRAGLCASVEWTGGCLPCLRVVQSPSRRGCVSPRSGGR